MTKAEMRMLLESFNLPEYMQWNLERVVTCVDFLQTQIDLSELRTLDLGHDTHVGVLLTLAGVRLIGNIAPRVLGEIDEPSPTSRFELPNGKICEWTLDEFDFEQKFPYPDHSFDLITALEVIEHVVGSPRAFVREVKRVLKPGGAFFVATPNINSWPKIVRQLQHAPVYDSKPYSQEFGPRHYMCHVYEYSPWELRELLKSEGFDVACVRTWNPYPSDPRGLRNALLRTFVAGSLFVCKRSIDVVWRSALG